MPTTPDTKVVSHADFALRMKQAMEGSGDVPQPNYGRLKWFVDQLSQRFSLETTEESVRKWISGQARPRPKTITMLAGLLKVDEAWLSVGHLAEGTQKERKLRNATADGAVNLIAGLIQMDGWNPAFPADDDVRATKNHTDIFVVIRGAHYALHVATGILRDGDWYFSIPIEALEQNVVLGLRRVDTFSFEIVELDSEGLAVAGKRKGALIELVDDGSRQWRKVISFTDRL